MNYRIAENNGVVQVGLEGALNFAANEEFQAMLEKIVGAAPRQVIFNLAALTSVDSVGLGLLYIAREDLSALNAKVTLSSPKGTVSRLLELTEADKTFEIIP